jgi:P27 family predicted phage terminase small subunit
MPDGIPRPPGWLSPGARKLWKQITPLIPGFHPVLDVMVVSIYVALLDQVAEARAKLAQKGLSEQERYLWEELLANWESQAREWAGELGLTPASRLEIKQALKLERRKFYGNTGGR